MSRTESLWDAAARASLSVFFSLYYPYARLLTTLMPSITLDGKKLWIPPTVYKPLENEHRFREFVRPGDRVCDLGCGSGVVSVFVADKASSVVALDIGPQAVEATRENCRRHGLTNVEVYKSDMFEAAEGKFDCICANPPFVEITKEDEDLQWATSERYLTRLFSEGKSYLKEGGRIVVLYPKSKEPRLRAFAEPEGLTLVSTETVSPKTPQLWLTCAIYLELFFNAQFHVFELR